MTKGNGVTHFTELHRTLHKNFLIWRWQKTPPFYYSTNPIFKSNLLSVPPSPLIT